MPRPCSICQHPDRKAIDKALLEAAPKRRIAADYGVAESSLRRHRSHVAKSIEKAEAKREASIEESVLAKLDRLESRLETLYQDSVALLARVRESEDTAAGVRACNAVRAVLAESRQQIEVLGELRGELDRRPVVNLAVLAPAVISAFDSIVDPEARRAAKVAVAAKLQELDRTLELPPA